MTISFPNLLLDWFFPRLCFGCGRDGVWVCPDCLGRVSNEEVFVDYSRGMPGLVLSFFDFSSELVRDLLHGLKYEGLFELAVVLEDLVRLKIGSDVLRKKLFLPSGSAVLIPVPSSRDKRKRRGYNQAEELARAISSWLGWPVWPEALRRSGSTTQVGKTAVERSKQAKSVYTYSGIKVPLAYQELPWVLIDDLMTTGSTLEACASALQPLSSVPIRAITIAREA